MKKSRAPRSTSEASPDVTAEVAAVLAWLQKHSSEKVRTGMARYGLPSEHAYGVPVGTIQKLARELGRRHDLVDALWATRVYEARLLVSWIGESAKLTSAQMERWCRDFDNWGLVDTLCFKLFDQSPLAWKKVAPWCAREPEFEKRAGFVLIACLAAHSRHRSQELFLPLLALVEAGATDERNFVKKGVSWALRMLGRHSLRLHTESLALAQRLASSEQPAARWVGKDALKDLSKPAVKKRLAAR